MRSRWATWGKHRARLRRERLSRRSGTMADNGLPDLAFRRIPMNRKPHIFRSLVAILAASGLLIASLGASADHRHHRRHSNDLAEGLLAGALAALTIGVILESVDSSHGRRHTHYRRSPERPSWKYRHGPRRHGWRDGHRHGHWHGHRHWKRHRHGHHYRPYRTRHWRADRVMIDHRPSHDRRIPERRH